MTQLTDPPPGSQSCSPPIPLPTPPLPLRIITHNIRYAASASQRLPQEPPWPSRLPLLSSQFHFLTRLRFSPPHSLICLQEVLTNQIQDLAKAIGNEWAWVGVGRDDGVDEGERCVIMYRKLHWQRQSFQTHWLNETGEVGKKGWDAGSVRVVSLLVLDAVTGSGSGKRVLILNTHLDNAGPESRKHSAELLLRILAYRIQVHDPDFYILAGDLNSESDGDAYKLINGNGSGLRDALTHVPVDVVGSESRYGEYDTYTGFDGEGEEDGKPERIDFVFVKDEGRVNDDKERVKSYAVMPNIWADSLTGRMSDHRAVCVDLLV